VDLRDKGGGEFGFFLGKDGIYRVEGVSCIKITDAFDDLFDLNSALYIDFANVETQASGSVHKTREWYICAVPLRTSGSAQTTNNYWMVFNYRTGAAFLFDIVADSVGIYQDTLKQKRLVHGGHGDGDIYLDDDDANNRDNGVNIAAVFDTGQMPFDPAGFNRAIIQDILFRYKQVGGTLQLSAYPDHQTTLIDLGSMSISGSGNTTKWRGINCDIEAMTMALKVRHNYSASPPTIYDMRIPFKIESHGDRR